MSLRQDGLPGCCGINVLHYFNGIKDGENKDWSVAVLAQSLGKKTTYDNGDKPMLQPLVIFSHSDAQDDKLFSPKSFAEWLRSRGERVYETKAYQHKRHETIITGYMWHPSIAFRKEYELACAK